MKHCEQYLNKEQAPSSEYKTRAFEKYCKSEEGRRRLNDAYFYLIPEGIKAMIDPPEQLQS